MQNYAIAGGEWLYIRAFCHLLSRTSQTIENVHSDDHYGRYHPEYLDMLYPFQSYEFSAFGHISAPYHKLLYLTFGEPSDQGINALRLVCHASADTAPDLLLTAVHAEVSSRQRLPDFAANALQPLHSNLTPRLTNATPSEDPRLSSVGRRFALSTKDILSLRDVCNKVINNSLSFEKLAQDSACLPRTTSSQLS